MSAAVLVASFAVSLAPHAASAQTSSQTAVNETAKMMVGAYEFSNADRDRRCAVTLKAEPAGPAGLKLEFDKDCVTVFAFVKDIAGWTIAENDFLRLNDAKGKPVLEMSEVEHGIFEVPRPGEGVLFLQNAAALAPPPPPPEQMAGDWDMVRAGAKICSLTLGNASAGEGNLALAVKPGCDAAIVRFGLAGWQMDRSELVLKGARNQTWRFEEGDDKSWRRVPETRDSLSLVRP